MKRHTLAVVAALLATGIHAEIISLNFHGTSDTPLASTDVAGAYGTEAGNNLGSTHVGNWNNLLNRSGSISTLMDNVGNIVLGLAASWNADNTWRINTDLTLGNNATADNLMMKGYLDNKYTGNTTVSLSGLTPASDSYSVIVYFDAWPGANITREGTYTIGSESIVGKVYKDTTFNTGAGGNPDGLFKLPRQTGYGTWPDDSANMIVFSGLTGDSFTLTVAPGAASDNVPRAPVNGIQVVGVIPEPTTASLLCVMGLGFFSLRRFISPRRIRH